MWGSSSSSLGVSSPLCSALSLPDCLKTQQSPWVWFAGFLGVLWIWHILSKILFKLDSSSLLSLRGSFFMTLPRAFESGVDCRALRAASLGPALVLAMSRFSVSIPRFGCTWVAGAASCQPAILSYAKAGHEACQCSHCPWLFLAEVSGEPFISNAVFESC